MSDNSISSNRSTLREFLASISTIQGDLSNITAPPFVLAERSTVELPQYWADHPGLFVSPALASTPEERILRVLKWFLGSLKNQQYAGRKEFEGIKKPLNAFLGELFFGSFNDEDVGETRLVSEQVSHHPPITACYLWNDKHGIRAEGFTCQEITFSGSVGIKQKGYAILHIDEYEEDYLIPVPNVKIKGVLTGTPYPELSGKYSISCSTGFISEVKFEGKGIISGGTKNGLAARVYHVDKPSEDIYTIEGQWNRSFTILDARTGEQLETYDVDVLGSAKMDIPNRQEQDPWETRRAWGKVIDAMNRSDMKRVADEKSIIEEGQRQMRREEEEKGVVWKRIFFQKLNDDKVFDKLSAVDESSFNVDPEGGLWRVNKEAIVNTQKPYHGDLVPTGKVLVASNKNQTADMPRAVDKDKKNVEDTSRSAIGELKPETKPQEEFGQAQLALSRQTENQGKLERIQMEEILRAKYGPATSH
ncbi:Oxysterol-binding protein [Lojkania enalia]|uniref:Oxysterol-binding protein n=1 Tax=Lojkania enalia TaxID=147567 RepID=A0A9P4N172_9PLEO|nr:Oxysterol-binding protein [Didymosphaeria enalia]